MKLYWQGKIDVLGDISAPLSLDPPLTQHTLIWDRTRVSVMTDLRLTTYLKQKSRLIATFKISKGYTFSGLNVSTYSQ